MTPTLTFINLGLYAFKVSLRRWHCEHFGLNGYVWLAEYIGIVFLFSGFMILYDGILGFKGLGWFYGFVLLLLIS